MIATLKALVMQLPIVKLLRLHRDEQCEANCQKQELLERQRDTERRIEWIEKERSVHNQEFPE